MRINNNIAVISGGASGMGAETARHLRRLGAQVAILDNNPDNVERAGKELDVLAICCDVTKEEEVKQAITEIEKALGIPRICVNCAGIAPAHLIVGKDRSAMPLQHFNQVIQVNLIGTFNVMSAMAARMSTLEPEKNSKENGVIINTASIAAFEGQIGQLAYSASKGGIVSMTLPAARELARYGIRVMTIAPGLMDTPMLQGLPDNVRESLASTVTFPKRFGEPSEFASLVVHIIENAFLNGSVIRLDGALRMAAR